MSARLSTMRSVPTPSREMKRWTGDHNESTAGRNGVRAHARVHAKVRTGPEMARFPILTPRLAHVDVGAHINGIDIEGSS